MASKPPRPIAPGDVVATFSHRLGEWTAAQIVHLDFDHKLAAVLELDWSGPEPTSVADLGDVAPLRLTHHAHSGRLSYCNYDWVLPRGYKVVGTMPRLLDEPPNAFGFGWDVGDQLARQRRWDAGDRGDALEPWKAEYTGADLARVLDEPAPPRTGVQTLHVEGVETLDCDRLVRRFPALMELILRGNLGLLTAAASLNELGELRSLFIIDLFGMTKADRLLPGRAPHLETLVLHSVPAEYAASMRSTWRPEVANGTYVGITSARKPDWVAENRENPLRDWDGREHIGKAQFKKSVAQYKTTRRAVLEVLADSGDDRPARLTDIGREYGEAFNRLAARTDFIETVEREELFEALARIVREAETVHGADLAWARESLYDGVQDVRDW